MPAQGLVTMLQVGWDGCFPCSTSEQTRPSIHGCCLGKGGPGLETFCGWRVFGFVQAACSRESLYFGGWCDLKILKPTDLKTSVFLAGGQKREVFVLKANLGKDCWVSSFTSPGEQNWKEKKGKQVIPALRWSFSLALLPQCFFLVIPPHLCMHPKKKPQTTNCHESRMEVEKQAAEKDEQPLSCAKCSVPSERHVSLLEVWALFVAHPQTCHRLSGSIWAGAAYGKCSTCLCEGSHFCLKSWDTTLVSLFRQTSYFCTSNPGAPDRLKSLAIRKLCFASKLRYNFTTGWFIFTHICLRM